MDKNTIKYALTHWNDYKLTDTKEDFFALLNILDAHGETLDSLHYVAFSGANEFCGIIGSFDDDRDTANALFDFNVFYEKPEDIANLIFEEIEDYKDAGYTNEEIDKEIKDTYCDDKNGDNVITRTFGGYVRTVAY